MAAAGKQAGTNANIRKTSQYGRRNTVYVQGNTARQLDVRTVLARESGPQLSHAARKNREKAQHMNPGYVLFLSLALLMTAAMLISYIELQSNITANVKTIASLESELNSKKLENDEEYSRITSSVDLEEIKRIALEELGMKYASEGQIVSYSSEGSDFVRQLTDIEQSR